MCDFSKGFKLCSCDVDNIKGTDIGWYLQRKNENLPLIERMGKAYVIPSPDAYEVSTKKLILQRLDEGNCFDFEYQPQQDDLLRIKIKNGDKLEPPTDGKFTLTPANMGIWVVFRFTNGCWVPDDSSRYGGWKGQLVHYDKGEIKEHVQLSYIEKTKLAILRLKDVILPK